MSLAIIFSNALAENFGTIQQLRAKIIDYRPSDTYY